MGAGLAAAAKNNANLQRLGFALPGLYCPTRRNALAYPWALGWRLTNIGSGPLTVVGRTDYTANAGDNCDSEYCGEPAHPSWASGVPNDDGGPASLEDGGVAGTTPPTATQLANARKTFNDMATWMTGVVYRGSIIRMSDITDGASKTYLAGEKKLFPDYYYNGYDGGDNEAAFVGDDNDTERWTGYTNGDAELALALRPQQDLRPAQFRYARLLRPMGIRLRAPKRFDDGFLRRLGSIGQLFHRP